MLVDVQGESAKNALWMLTLQPASTTCSVSISSAHASSSSSSSSYRHL